MLLLALPVHRATRELHCCLHPPACLPPLQPPPPRPPAGQLVNATVIAQRGIQIHQHGLILHLILTVGAAWAVGQGVPCEGGVPCRGGSPTTGRGGVLFPPNFPAVKLNMRLGGQRWRNLGCFKGD